MQTKCDNCSSSLIPILWGHPMGFPESIWELAKNGQILIGGCPLSDEDKKSYCPDCNKYYDKLAEIPDDMF